MATILDVATKANVSVITVSRLLNNPEIVSKKTADKIFRVMEELNYQPNQIARSLVNKRTNTIGVIMPDIKNTFFNNWFRFIEDYASKHSFNLLLCNTDEDPSVEMKYIKLLQAQRVDAVIIVPSSKAAVEYLVKSEMRFVLMDRLFKDLDTDYVTADHFKGAYEGTEYLIKLGHRKIGVLNGPGILYSDIERTAGFKKAMKDNNLEISRELIINCEFNEEMAYEGTISLLERDEKPTAIFSFNSVMTVGVIKALQKMRLKIGKDISLLGFDEIPGQDIFQPRITYIKQPVDMLGKDIIVSLVDRIKKDDNSKRLKIVLDPQLVAGKSCREA